MSATDAKARLLREKYPLSLFAICVRQKAELAFKNGDTKKIQELLEWQEEWL